MQKIFIAILTSGNIRIELAVWLIRRMQEVKYDIEMRAFWMEPVQSNRNKIVKEFLESDKDYLLMIDSDIVPCENYFDLIQYNKDIISGVCCVWKNTELMPLVIRDTPNGKIEIVKEKGLVEVDKVGTGALIIHKSVFQKIKKPFEVFFDKNGIKKGVGEDINFCIKAKRAGFKIWVHTDYLCDHYSIVNIEAIYKFLQDIIDSSQEKRSGEENE